MSVTEELDKLFLDWTGMEADAIRPLPPAGSSRSYYRLLGSCKSAIGVWGRDLKENRAFIEFTRYFLDKDLPVSELYTVSKDEQFYLIQDLGDTTLNMKVMADREQNGRISRGSLELYRQALNDLLEFQFRGDEALDYSLCVPRQAFDRQSVLWDLNHFKYYWPKLNNIPFDEDRLEKDFRKFSDYLTGDIPYFFMYRDFQSRNIMLPGNRPYYVDYQGGRKGPPAYDVASLLWESKVDLSPGQRHELLEYYLSGLKEYQPGFPDHFRKTYYPFVLVRILQVLGAYGLRGLHEGKTLFLQSIPYAMNNLRWMKEQGHIPSWLPELDSLILKMTEEDWGEVPGNKKEKLEVEINSFSYRYGVPRDLSGHGGGFVFDCRGLPNPGRLEEFRDMTGQDEPVRAFLRKGSEAEVFFGRAADMVRASIQEYQKRGYKRLVVNFGCTGGQHRSVYCAEKLASELAGDELIDVRIRHHQLEIMGRLKKEG